MWFDSVVCRLNAKNPKLENVLARIKKCGSTVGQNVGITGAAAPLLNVVVFAKPRITPLSNILRIYTINASWSNCLGRGMSKLTVSVANVIKITSLCHGSLTACGSTIVSNPGPEIVTSKC